MYQQECQWDEPLDDDADATTIQQRRTMFRSTVTKSALKEEWFRDIEEYQSYTKATANEDNEFNPDKLKKRHALVAHNIARTLQTDIVPEIVNIIIQYSAMIRGAGIFHTENRLSFVTYSVPMEKINKIVTLTQKSSKTEIRAEYFGDFEYEGQSKPIKIANVTRATCRHDYHVLRLFTDEPDRRRSPYERPPHVYCQLHYLDENGDPYMSDANFILRWIRDHGIELEDYTGVRMGRPYVVSACHEQPSKTNHWAVQRQQEFLSVASFSKFALELMEIGAPVEYILDCFKFADDELRHAQICQFLVEVLSVGGDGRTEELFEECRVKITAECVPAHLLRVDTELKKFLIETIKNGCINEAVSAVISMHQAKTFDNDKFSRNGNRLIQEKLKSVAADEVEHCVLAWKVVAWCLERFQEESVLDMQLWMDLFGKFHVSVGQEVGGNDDCRDEGFVGRETRLKLCVSTWIGVTRPALEMMMKSRCVSDVEDCVRDLFGSFAF